MYGRWRNWVTQCQASKPVSPTILPEWLEASRLSSIMLPLLKVLEEAATWCNPVWASTHHQDACMPAMHMFQRVVVVKTPTGGPLSENAYQNDTWKYKAYTTEDVNIYKQLVGGSTLKKKLNCRRSIA